MFLTRNENSRGNLSFFGLAIVFGVIGMSGIFYQPSVPTVVN